MHNGVSFLETAEHKTEGKSTNWQRKTQIIFYVFGYG